MRWFGDGHFGGKDEPKMQLAPDKCVKHGGLAEGGHDDYAGSRLRYSQRKYSCGCEHTFDDRDPLVGMCERRREMWKAELLERPEG